MEQKEMKKEKRRMTEKLCQPSEETIRLFMGDDAWERLMKLEGMLEQRYELGREVRFPFGNSYGWSFRYTSKKSLLLYVFFEDGGFCCTISISDSGAKQVEAMREGLHPEVQKHWDNRYPCGSTGGWMNCSVESDEEIPDLVRLIGVKVPSKKICHQH